MQTNWTCLEALQGLLSLIMGPRLQGRVRQIEVYAKYMKRLPPTQANL